ncbi:MAG: chorismate mutase [Alphaproteobacteria bacterium]|nr:chorismate mutase [Alphaproteobacteria bacterium]
MISSEAALEDLRREIDRVDDSIHDLLIHRVGIVQRIAQVKREGGLRFRPGREARMLRRLIARHRGPFPKPVLARIWREMLGATVRMQGEFSIGVYAVNGEQGCWDLARNHFGAHAPIMLHASAGQIVSDVAGGKATAGVLPRPREDDPQPWWPLLLTGEGAMPRIVARLPFAGRIRGRAEDIDAVVIACQPPEDSGDDITLVAIDMADTVSRATLKSAMRRCDLEPLFFASRHDPNKAGRETTLTEVKGFVLQDDKRLQRLAGTPRGGIQKVQVVGGYAVPLAERMLAEG